VQAALRIQILFQDLNGNDTIASGDDVFLLQKAIKIPEKVYYLKSDNIVIHKTIERLEIIMLSARPLGIKPVHQSTFGKDWGY
jgi:hypothetical protein